MHSSRLKINTALPDVSARIRSASNASTSSSISVVTPFSASTDASSSSVNLHVPYALRRPDARSPSPRSPRFSLSSPKNEYVLAMHDYSPQQQSATCLSFRAGQVIHVLNKDPSGWWDGELEGRRGWFPSNYVNVESDWSDDSPKETRRFGIKARRLAGASDIIPKNSPPMKSRRDMDENPIDSYCPSLMVQLISVFTVMQDAVHKQKEAHYLPAAAHIVKHVRHILTAMGTVYKSAPVLQKHPALARERKELLRTLTPLIESAKLASAALPSRRQDLAVEAMMHCAMDFQTPE
ncbi:hypothetical protein AX14_013958 [Amanita brunnescens Koide BX004]|nr:hypothetical protein AX14_013958 [Amanita brunnescens Koide BX004]